ncbi:hypothetical protein Pla144_50990 [Bythopirellula polymerisocia]|uniref:Uncharacterized protein n=1 Tax=Bythopirellula polymerisocia TaxID=2528003 RepID=A0A5C6C0V1_9BACT|nr:hypothetical protein Pla144_50990 [Bythopirellula polymerisocia]
MKAFSTEQTLLNSIKYSAEIEDITSFCRLVKAHLKNNGSSSSSVDSQNYWDLIEKISKEKIKEN